MALRDGLPQSQLAVVPGTSHGLLADKPDLCNRLIIDFLTEPIESAVAPTGAGGNGHG